MQYFVKFSIPYQLPWDISLFCISKSVSCTQVCFINKISDGIVYIIHYLKLCILTHMVTMNTFLRSPTAPSGTALHFFDPSISCSPNPILPEKEIKRTESCINPHVCLASSMSWQFSKTSAPLCITNMAYYITCITNPLSNIVNVMQVQRTTLPWVTTGSKPQVTWLASLNPETRSTS